MPLKILATADIHIGRRPSKVLDSAEAGRFSCARMWESIVQRAVSESVDLVVLAGDVVEHDNRFFEATGPLEAGLAKLAAAGIDTYAVAGNHDFDVLSRIVDSVGGDRLHLLGRDGRWEESLVEKDGRPVLRVHGWSFPANHVAESPLADYDLPPSDDLPTLGLLHADLGAQGSRYAPVTQSELASTGVAIWVLGHVHTPRYIDATSGPPTLYPGSPQAMDPGETGQHGPWLIEIQGPHQASATLLPMSKVRYDVLEVDLSDISTKDDFQSRVVSQIGRHLDSLASDPSPLEYVSLRLEFGGRTSVCSQIDDWSRRMLDDYERCSGDVTGRIDTVTNNTLPAIDLAELSQNRDPPGVLARTLASLESDRPNETVATLVRDAHRKILEVHEASAYSGSVQQDQPPGLDDARRHLIRQARLLLDRLLAQERTA